MKMVGGILVKIREHECDSLGTLTIRPAPSLNDSRLEIVGMAQIDRHSLIFAYRNKVRELLIF